MQGHNLHEDIYVPVEEKRSDSICLATWPRRDITQTYDEDGCLNFLAVSVVHLIGYSFDPAQSQYSCRNTGNTRNLANKTFPRFCTGGHLLELVCLSPFVLQ